MRQVDLIGLVVGQAHALVGKAGVRHVLVTVGEVRLLAVTVAAVDGNCGAGEQGLPRRGEPALRRVHHHRTADAA